MSLIDEPCPICGGPCSTWSISDDPNEDMVLCWTGDYKVRGLENHKRLSGIMKAAEALAKALKDEREHDYDCDYSDITSSVEMALIEVVEGGRSDGR